MSSIRIHSGAGMCISANSYCINRYRHHEGVMPMCQRNVAFAFRRAMLPGVADWQVFLLPPDLRSDAMKEQQQTCATRASIQAVVTTYDECILACDVGTGGTKVAIVDRVGLIVASAFSAHARTTQSQKDGVTIMEQESEEWWLATQEASQSCFSQMKDLGDQGFDASRVKAVAVTGQMQDIIPLPKDPTQEAAPAILYSDTRAHLESNKVNELCGGRDQLATMTGSAQGAASVLAKLMWLDRHDATYFEDSHTLLLGGHDYVVYQMCGALVTDATTASTTGLTLIESPGAYAAGVLETLGLSRWLEKLPPIHAVDKPCGELLPDAAEALGAAELSGIPVFHSCGDAGASTVGCGAGRPGVQYIYLGSSGWMAGSFPRGADPPGSSGRLHTPGVFTLAHPDPGLVFKTGSIMTAGGNLAWAAEAFGDQTSGDLSRAEQFDRVNSLASRVPAGSGGLLYLPFLNGERCPFDDGDARAAFVGLSASTQTGHLYRAVMEGTAFAFRSARDALAGDVTPGETGSEEKLPLRLVGGGARSSVWHSIIAGVFGQDVETIQDSQEVGVKGAAILAGRWLGWDDSLNPSGHWVKVARRLTPEANDVKLYDKLFESYTKLYPALKSTFQELAALR